MAYSKIAFKDVIMCFLFLLALINGPARLLHIHIQILDSIGDSNCIITCPACSMKHVWYQGNFILKKQIYLC